MIFSESFSFLTCDEVILVSDEAHFHLLGTANKQNFRYWVDSNPQQLHHRPVHSPRVTVRCRVASRRLFFWRGWISSYNNVCSVCGDVKELSCFRITSSWSWLQDVVVPARWWNSPYCQHIHEGSVRNVSGPGCFKRRRHFIASTFSWHLSLWLLSLG